jgi:hypothetical protein
MSTLAKELNMHFQMTSKYLENGQHPYPTGIPKQNYIGILSHSSQNAH